MIATILFGFPTESLKLTSILEVSKRVWLDDGGTSDRLHSSGIYQQTPPRRGMQILTFLDV